MRWLTQFIPPKIRSLAPKDLPDHLWNKCSQCMQMIFHKELKQNLFVCRHCGCHLSWEPTERLNYLFDEGDYQTVPMAQVEADPLNFRDQKRYTDRLKEARTQTNQTDAMITAFGKVKQFPIMAVCFNFAFIGGSMGMAVGQGLWQAAQWCLDHRCPLLIITSSGGARMQEGILSLMQMPRSVIALQLLQENGLPVFILMTNPTMGGVAASFASLGDVILAEPGAIIGFTGARIIRETLRQPLPTGFQTAEFQKKHGFVDALVDRTEFPTVLGHLLKFFQTPRLHDQTLSLR